MVVKFNTGNFTLNIDGDFNDEAKAAALENGLRYAVQRDVASKVYVQLAGEKNSNGNLQLPKGFERDAVAFSADNAAAMELAASEELKKLGTFTVSVEENVGGETAASPMKRATALVESFLGTPMEAPYREILGLPNGTKEELIAEANKLRLGISVPKGVAAKRAATAEPVAV